MTKSLVKEKVVYDIDIYNTVRKNIRKYRMEKKMTSAQLAELTDLSHDYIRQIESQKTAYNFSFMTFYKITIALGVSMDKLIKKD